MAGTTGPSRTPHQAGEASWPASRRRRVRSSRRCEARHHYRLLASASGARAKARSAEALLDHRCCCSGQSPTRARRRRHRRRHGDRGPNPDRRRQGPVGRPAARRSTAAGSSVPAGEAAARRDRADVACRPTSLTRRLGCGPTRHVSPSEFTERGSVYGHGNGPSWLLLSLRPRISSSMPVSRWASSWTIGRAGEGIAKAGRAGRRRRLGRLGC
jgi:hypothetical protein